MAFPPRSKPGAWRRRLDARCPVEGWGWGRVVSSVCVSASVEGKKVTELHDLAGRARLSWCSEWEGRGGGGDVSIGDLIHDQTSRLGSSEWPGHTSLCCFLVRLARCSTDESCWCPAGAESCRIAVVVLCFVCVVGVAVMSRGRGDGCNGAQNDLRRARDDPAKDGGGHHRRGPHLSMRFVVEMVVVVVLVGRGGEGHNNTRRSWAKT